MEPIVELNRYDRATVALWARGQTELADCQHQNYLAGIAVHAVLAKLRQWAQREALFTIYERDPAADFTLIESLVGRADDPRSELLWRIRDAAFFLRWQEIDGTNA
jgi:hypothetical protein